MRKISTRTRKSIVRNYLQAVAAKVHDGESRSGVTETGLHGVRGARAAKRMTLSSAAAGVAGRTERIRRMH